MNEQTPNSKPRLNPMMMLGMMQALTGVSIDDMLREAEATTPEEKTKAQVLTLRKMEAHRKGISLEDVPDFFNYPETGKAPDGNTTA